MKKRLLTLTALAAMLILALTACGGGQGGNGSAHPWKWTKKGDDIRLTIKNAPQEGYAWTYTDISDGRITVTRTDSGSGSDAVFTLSAVEGGNGMVEFVCQREAQPHDAAFTLEIALRTDEKGKLTVDSAEYVEPLSGGSVGEEGKPGTVWYVTPENVTEIYLESGNWSVLGYDEALVRVSDPTYGEGGCTYALEGLDAGTTEIYFYDMRADYGFRYTLETATDLTATVTACEAGTFAVATEATPGYDAAAALVGEIKLPAGVSAIRTSTGAWYGGDEEDYAEMRIKANGAEWSLTVTKAYTRDELADLFVDDAQDAEKTETAVGDTSAVLCAYEGDFVLCWSDAAGRAYALAPMDDGATQDALFALAESIISAQ